MATKREEYIEKLDKQLREWNHKIDTYQAEAEGRSQKIQNQLNKKIQESKRKRSKLRHKLNEIKDSGGDTFERMRQDTEILWNDVKIGFNELRSILKR